MQKVISLDLEIIDLLQCLIKGINQKIMEVEIVPIIILAAALLSFLDTSLGMGYGTSIIAMLLLLGFSPLEAVPAVLFTNAILGILSGISHHKYENVDFNTHTRDFRVMISLTVFGIVGVLTAITIAIKVPENFLKGYIGLLVFMIGAIIILKRKAKHRFSWSKINLLGLFAGFNKGLSGGGYGPVVVGGQILSGVRSTKAVGIAALAEGLISIVGVVAYYMSNAEVHLNWSLIISLLVGGTLTVPIAAYVVQKYHPHNLRRIIGIVSVALGASILIQLFME